MTLTFLNCEFPFVFIHLLRSKLLDRTVKDVIKKPSQEGKFVLIGQ